MRRSAGRAIVKIGVLLFLSAMVVRISDSRAQPQAPIQPASQPNGRPHCTVPPAVPNLPPPTRSAQTKSAAHLRQAEQAYVIRDFVQAIWHLHAAYELVPHPEVLYNLAQSCREAGSEVEALALYERTLQGTQNETTREDCERHIATLRQRLAAQEDQRATKHLQDHDFALAVLTWEAAYKFMQNSLYLFHIAQAQRLAEKPDEAILAYERFLATAPESAFIPEAKHYVAKLRAGKADAQANQLFESHRYDEAIVAWDSAYQISLETVFLFRIAEAHRLASDIPKARAGYERFLRETPRGELTELRQQSAERLRQFELDAAQARELSQRRAYEQRPVYKKWWFWTILGGVAAGAIGIGVAAAVVSRPPAFFDGIPSENQRSLNPQ